MKTTVLCAVLLGIVAACCATDRVVVSRRSFLPPGWKSVQHNENAEVKFSVLLRRQNMPEFFEAFEAISNPASARWGKYFTTEELAALISPTQETFKSVKQWLSESNAVMDIEQTMDSVLVRTTAAAASALFQTTFKTFLHSRTGTKLVRHMGEASIPAFAAGEVEFVAGISEFLDIGDMRTKVMPRQGPMPGANIAITPSVLRARYNVPSNLTATNPKTYQGVAAFADEFSMGALRAFESNMGLPKANVTRKGANCFSDPILCDQYESDLDMQYITAMARGANTLFLANGENYWLLEFTEQLLKLDDMPSVFSISYGWPTLRQCQQQTVDCAQVGYDSLKYVERTNQDFALIGSKGTSILAASGDSGAPGMYGASGNNPLDLTNYCPTGGCGHDWTYCGAFLFTNLTAEPQVNCSFPMGFISGTANCSDPNDAFDPAINAFVALNADCQVEYDIDAGGFLQIFSVCECQYLKPYTDSNYHFEGYTFNQANGQVFAPDYPASSPFVTAVGASQFISYDGQTIACEVPANIENHIAITSGGGFDYVQPAQAYQKEAVADYFANKNTTFPPAWAFNSSGRGFPDITMNGHLFLIYASDLSDACPCQPTYVDGTSASSPTLAGMMTLINDQLLNANKSVLGFLNPVLYSAYAAYPAAFNELSPGNNKCSEAYCNVYGYESAPGTWDPVSGLGTPNFENLMNYILHLKGVKEMDQKNFKKYVPFGGAA